MIVIPAYYAVRWKDCNTWCPPHSHTTRERLRRDTQQNNAPVKSGMVSVRLRDIKCMVAISIVLFLCGKLGLRVVYYLRGG